MSSLKYVVESQKIELEESRRDEDIEFMIKVKKEEIKKVLHEIRQFFESDAIYTDILFYTYKTHLQVIVKKDSYLSFLFGLFKWKLLKSIQWNEE